MCTKGMSIVEFGFKFSAEKVNRGQDATHQQDFYNAKVFIRCRAEIQTCKNRESERKKKTL